MPKLPDRIALRTKEEWIKDRQKRNFDTRHRARSLSPLQTGDAVWVADNEKSGTVVEESAPRSYLVATPDGTYRRNRRHLISTTPPITTPMNQPTQEAENSPTVGIRRDNIVQTRSGRISKPPDRLIVGLD